MWHRFYENKVAWFCLWKTFSGSYLKQNSSDLVFSNPHHFLKMSKFVPGHVTKMCSVNFWHPQDSNSLFNGSIGYVTRWPPIGICSGRLKLRQSIICFTLKSFFPFALCPLPLPFIASFTWAVFIFQFILLLFPTKPAAKNRSYSLTCIFSGCASSPNRILQLFTRSTWKINSHLYFEEFSKCDRTYPTGMNHGAG